MAIVRTHFGPEYDTKTRLASYWHQVDECLRLGGKTVLLVGKGSGLETIMLERRSLEVTTLDNQPQLAPDIAGDVCAIPVEDQSFDIACCCQVLEHLPHERFTQAPSELRRVVRIGLVLSLPDSARYSTTLSRLLRRKEILNVPLPRKQPHKEHLWEVNADGHPLSAIQRGIDASGFVTERTFRVWELPYHRFWRLRRNGQIV